jgi:hypothetical protein
VLPQQVLVLLGAVIMPQACVVPLQSMLSRAYTMHAARAYLHQYDAHGLGSTDLQQSFAVVEDLLAAYAAL